MSIALINSNNDGKGNNNSKSNGNNKNNLTWIETNKHSSNGDSDSNGNNNSNSNLTWVGTNKHCGPFKSTNSTILLVLLPVTIESIRCMSHDRVGRATAPVPLDRATIRATRPTRVIQRHLQLLQWHTWLRQTPQFLFHHWRSRHWFTNLTNHRRRSHRPTMDLRWSRMVTVRVRITRRETVTITVRMRRAARRRQ
ncbi:hypothetical protein Hanom_Chr12g01103511 [Helianthus anomalus]